MTNYVTNNPNKNHKPNIDFVIMYALIAALSLILSFMSYVEGKPILMIIWFINCILNIIVSYLNYKRR